MTPGSCVKDACVIIDPKAEDATRTVVVPSADVRECSPSGCTLLTYGNFIHNTENTYGGCK